MFLVLPKSAELSIRILVWNNFPLKFVVSKLAGSHAPELAQLSATQAPREVEMWRNIALPSSPLSLFALFLVYRRWDKYWEMRTRISRLRSLGAL